MDLRYIERQSVFLMFIGTRFFPFSSFVSIIHPTRFVVQRKIRTWNISRSSARRARMLDFSSAFPFLKDTKRRFSNCERRWSSRAKIRRRARNFVVTDYLRNLGLELVKSAFHEQFSNRTRKLSFPPWKT